MLVVVNMLTFTTHGSKFDYRGCIFPVVSVRNTLYIATELNDTETLYFIVTLAEINSNLEVMVSEQKTQLESKETEIMLMNFCFTSFALY